MKKYILFLTVLAIVSCSSLEKRRFENANVYINAHLQMSDLNRIAMLEGMIIIGMNPCESIAAVGEPYSFEIKDTSGSRTAAKLTDILSKQCNDPDNRIIDFYFKDSFQYGKEQNYSVTYKNGQAVKIERGAVMEKGNDK
jgi:hypothetical protein